MYGVVAVLISQESTRKWNPSTSVCCQVEQERKPTIRTVLLLVVWGPRLLPQEIINGGTVSALRIVWRHEPAQHRNTVGSGDGSSSSGVRLGQKRNLHSNQCAERGTPFSFPTLYTALHVAWVW